MDEILAAYDDEENAENLDSSKKRRIDGEENRIKQAAGRYISKRERKAMAETVQATTAIPLNHQLPGSILDLKAPPEIEEFIDQFRIADGIIENAIPKSIRSYLIGHTKTVNAVRWSPTHGCLLASAGMDHKTCIWNVWDKKLQPVRTFQFHEAAVKDVQWSMHGSFLLTCGYDRTARLIDVETAQQMQKINNENYLTAVRFHPSENQMFISGDSKGVIKLWDIRSGELIRQYLKDAGQILDVDFSKDGKHFACTTDVAARNASDKTIMVWDFHTQIPLSNQVYLEAFTCPCIRYHPYEQAFVAQSSGDYIVKFSSRPPFKMNRLKRYQGHRVGGYPIRCNFSSDGELLVTGSSDGFLHFYSFRSSKLITRFPAHTDACTDVSFHPMLSTVVASCSWDGSVQVSM